MITEFKIFETNSENLQIYENKNLLDKNGDIIETGDNVIVPDPEGSDSWRYGDFSATVDHIDKKLGIITVVDSDGDCFDVESYRVEIDDEEYNQWLIDNKELIKKIGWDEIHDYYKNITKYNL